MAAPALTSSRPFSRPVMRGMDWMRGLPASPVVRAGDLVFVAGRSARSACGAVLAPGDVRAQAREALDGLERALAAAGATPDDVVDILSFHRDVRDVPAVLDEARRWFPGDPPAWTPVGMTGTGQPGVLVTIRAIAQIGGGPRRSAVPPGAAWMGEYPIAAACRKGDLVCVAGASGLDGDGGDPAPGDHGSHARRAYDRVAEALAAVGAAMDDVVDVCSFHLDPRGMVPCEAMHNEVWRQPPDRAPAWTAIGVPALFRPGMLAQYRVIADTSPGPRIGHATASIHWRDTSIAGASRKSGGRLVGIAGEVASDGRGDVTTPGDTAAQARYAFNRIREVVELHGGTMANVVEITSFHKDARARAIVMEQARAYFEADRGPAWTPVGVTGLWNPGYLHEIYALAVL